MNVHHAERIAGQPDEVGYAPIVDGAQPDVVVFINCTVRENADQTSSTATSATSSRSRTACPACRSSSALLAEEDQAMIDQRNGLARAMVRPVRVGQPTADQPPSEAIVWPVTQSASSLTSHATSFAASSGVLHRRPGLRVLTWVRVASSA